MGRHDAQLPESLSVESGLAAPHFVKPFVLESITTLLAAWDIVATQARITYLADMGTLLAAVRHAGPIPWDDDCDVIVMLDDQHILLTQARESLNRMGLELYQYPFGFKVGRLHLDERGAPIDPPEPLFPFLDIWLGEVVASGEFRRVYLNTVDRHDYPHPGFPNPAGVSATDVLPPKRVPFLGTPEGVLVPRNAERMLDALMGDGHKEGGWAVKGDAGSWLVNHWGSAIGDYVHGAKARGLERTAEPPTMDLVNLQPAPGRVFRILHLPAFMFRNADFASTVQALCVPAGAMVVLVWLTNRGRQEPWCLRGDGSLRPMRVPVCAALCVAAMSALAGWWRGKRAARSRVASKDVMA